MSNAVKELTDMLVPISDFSRTGIDTHIPREHGLVGFFYEENAGGWY